MLLEPISREELARGRPRGAFNREWNQLIGTQSIVQASVAMLYPATQPESGAPDPTQVETDPPSMPHSESGWPDWTQSESTDTSLSDSVSSSARDSQVTTTGPISSQPESGITPLMARQAWQRAQAALALQLTTAESDALIQPVRFLGFEDGDLSVLAPDTVSRDLLTNRLRAWLKEHLAQLLGAYVDIHVVLDASAPEEPPDSPERVERDLVAAGVWEDVAARLVRDHGIEACRNQLAALKSLQRAVNIARPGGWLTRAIEQTWRH